MSPSTLSRNGKTNAKLEQNSADEENDNNDDNDDDDDDDNYDADEEMGGGKAPRKSDGAWTEDERKEDVEQFLLSLEGTWKSHFVNAFRRLTACTLLVMAW